MNRSKSTIITCLGVLATIIFMSTPLQISAQEADVKESKSVSISSSANGKVQLKVVTRKGNDETTFEKEYDSYDDMYNDPDLDKYGIDLGFPVQGFTNGQRPKFFQHKGPGAQFWNDEAFEAEIEELRKHMGEMMGSFGSANFFFDFDDQNFMNIDSLMQGFQFKNHNGKYFFNGEEIADLDSLQEALKDRFDNFQFDFDFDGDSDEDFDFWSNRDDDVKVIRRAKVYVRTARDEDKTLVGTDAMEDLTLNDISFYPNPSDGRFDLELKTANESPIQLIIVDGEGNEVFNKLKSPQEGFLSERIDLTTEGKGWYILTLMQNGKALTKRIVVE